MEAEAFKRLLTPAAAPAPASPAHAAGEGRPAGWEPSVGEQTMEGCKVSGLEGRPSGQRKGWIKSGQGKELKMGHSCEKTERISTGCVDDGETER